MENGNTCIGIRTRHGVVLACEKIISSKLLKPGTNKRISTVDRNSGVVCSGLLPDARHLTSRARDEASSWRQTYKAPIPISALASRMGGYVQAYTLYSSVRPFGVTAILGGWDSETELGVDGQVGFGPKVGAGGKFEEEAVKRGGPGLYMIEPSGLYWVCWLQVSNLTQTLTLLGVLWSCYGQRTTSRESRTRETGPRLTHVPSYAQRSRDGGSKNHLRCS